jgi:hypothetical protein
MTATPAKREGFTQIPNWLIDEPNLTAAEKWSVMVVARHAYGQKTSAFPSQVSIAKRGHFDRKTIRTALESVTDLGILEAIGKNGRSDQQVEYRLHLDSRPKKLDLRNTHPGDLGRTPHLPGDSTPTKHTEQEYEVKKTHVGIDVTSNIEDTVEPEVGSRIGRVCSANESGPGAYDPGASTPSKHTFTKRQINEQLLTPDGKRPDVDGLDCDLNEALIMAESPSYFPSSELDKLVAKRGEERCAFWASWLLRKIASEYERGKPVENPAGLFRTAVEQHWEVNPSWPEFDEHKHTDAAWKAKMGIGASTGTEVDELADEIPF